jgi:hypothetical protein
MKWQGKIKYKNKKMFEQKQLQIIEQEISQPFRPKINAEFQGFPSKDPFADQKQKESIKTPTYERLYNSHNEKIYKKELKQKESVPKFIPQINKTLPSYIKQKDKNLSRNLSSYLLLQDRSTNKSTITKSASMTNLMIKSEPVTRNNQMERSGELFVKNNSTINTIDNNVLFKPNLTNIVNSMLLEDEYNNFPDDSKWVLNKTSNSMLKRAQSSCSKKHLKY